MKLPRSTPESPDGPAPQRPVAVFDFDGTLIDTDVAYGFLETAINGHWLRKSAALALLPLVMPFLAMRRTRIVAMGLLMWLSTFPLRGRNARQIFSPFVPRVFAPPIGGRWFEEGQRTLAAHQRLGHRILIVSGSPQELVSQIVNHLLAVPVEVIGSRLEPFLGGLIYRRYCMGGEKIRVSRERGLLDGRWDYGYSDSALDLPLLAHCRHRFLVNGSPRTIRRVKATLGGRITLLNWETRAHGPQPHPKRRVMEIYDFLNRHGIAFQRFDHPPVFTCEDVNRLVPPLPGQKTKNLFVCDNKGARHFLVTVPDEKSVDLKSLGEALAVKKLRFASSDRLHTCLKLEPGAVTLLGVMNDVAGQVAVVMDKAIWQADALQCHPLVNTATLVISLENIRRFLEATGHSPTVMDVPARS